MAENNNNRPDFHWRGELPVSNTFDDVYYSSDGGLDESRYNFIDHSFLQERWSAKPGQDFCIAETGFGTGLNFLISWQLWQQQQAKTNKPQRKPQLHFYSIEKYPLTAQDLKKAHQVWPELAPFSQALLENYPQVLSPGLHTIVCDEQVVLHLVIDEVLAGIKRIKHSNHPAFASRNRFVDAWYLDGFTPKKNPLMWRKDVLTAVADLSKAEATFATFTAASQVRRDLQSLGFECFKASGFGMKRELLHGHFKTETVQAALDQEQTLQGKAEAYNSPHPAPWQLQAKVSSPNTVAIIGGGLAGCLSAYALSRQGIQVQLFDKDQQLAQAGSGNPQGIIYGKLSHREESLSQYNLLALQFAQNFYRPLIESGAVEGKNCGVVQLALNTKLEKAQQKLIQYLHSKQADKHWCAYKTPEQISELAGIDIEYPGLYFPNLGWLKPQSLCQYLVQQAGVQCQLGQEVNRLEQTELGWTLLDKQDRVLYQADAVIIANAHLAKQFEQSQGLPLKPVRGQISLAPDTDTGLKTVLCGEGYIAPAYQGQHCLGASFRPNSENTELNPQEQAENLRLLARDMPEVYQALGGDKHLEQMPCNGRAAVRAATPDYLPLVGPVPQLEEMRQRFALLAKNAKANISHTGAYYPGLYTACGFGSRGISYGPLAAVHLASVITGSTPVLETKLAQQLNPARFVIRNLIRGL